ARACRGAPRTDREDDAQAVAEDAEAHPVSDLPYRWVRLAGEKRQSEGEWAAESPSRARARAGHGSRDAASACCRWPSPGAVTAAAPVQLASNPPAAFVKIRAPPR